MNQKFNQVMKNFRNLGISWMKILFISVLLTPLLSCGPEIAGPIGLSIDNPLNNAAVQSPVNVSGSYMTQDKSLMSVVDLFYTMPYSADTNIISASILSAPTNNERGLFSAELSMSIGGFYYVWAIGTNASGEALSSEQILLIVESTNSSSTNTNQIDIIPPTVNVVSPTNNQVIGSSFTVAGTASDDNSGVEAVNISVDGGDFTPAALANGAFSANLSVSTSGIHSVSVFAVDNQGNASDTNSLNVNYIVGTPTVSITSPVSGTITTLSSVTVSGSASVDDGTVSLVQLKVNSGAYQNVTGTTSWSKGSVLLAEGTNVLIARAVSSFDVSNISGQITVIRDSVKPTVTIISPANGVELTNSSVTISGSSADTGTGVQSVYLSIDGGGFASLSSTANWNYPKTFTQGAHTAKAYCVDKAGNSSLTQQVSFTVTNHQAITPPEVSASPAGGNVNSSSTIVTLSLTGTADVCRYTTNGNDPSVSGTSFVNGNTVTLMIAEGGSLQLKLYAENSGGNDSAVYNFNYPTGDPFRPYSVNPTYGASVTTPITIDGENTAGEWSDSYLIAIDVANDDPRSLGDNWTMHETPFDCSHLYAAWDDEYLYLAWQYVDVTDIVDPANAGSAGGTKPNNMNLIQWIAVDTIQGEGCSIDMWGKNLGEPYWNGSDLPDVQVYIPSNLWNAGYISIASNGVFPVDDGGIYYKSGSVAGITAAVENVLVAGTLYGTNDVDDIGDCSGLIDFIAAGHDGSRDTFYEIKIPFSALYHPTGTVIDRNYIETVGIGVMLGQGETSCLDTLPNDPATLDTEGVSDSNSPLEWADSDLLSVDFARIGHAK